VVLTKAGTGKRTPGATAALSSRSWRSSALMLPCSSTLRASPPDSFRP
jgi:hypothetical protein